MGITSSSNAQLKENKFLIKFSSKLPLSKNDPIWNQLFSFTLLNLNSRERQVQLKEELECFCKSLFAHNHLTGNFTSLIKVFLDRASEVQSSAECENKLFVWQTYNALFIVGHLCKFMAENMSEVKILEQFESQSLAEQNKDLANGFLMGSLGEINLAQGLITALMDIIIDVPILDFTYQLHLESIKTLLTLLSVKMFKPFSKQDCSIYKLFTTSDCGAKINLFSQKLLQNFIEQRASPAESEPNTGQHASLVFRVTSALASSVWNAVSSHENQENVVTETDSIVPCLGQQSSLLLLVLINYNDYSDSNNIVFKNPYQHAFYKFCHIQGRQLTKIKNEETQPSFRVNFSRLYTTLYQSQHNESSTLLLYFLLHGNPEVRSYVLSITDIESLILPLLHTLYLASIKNSHHIYMSLIILLILTEDDHFNRSVHEIKLKNTSWYTERILVNVSLGDLIILVLIRVIQFNVCRVRDQYLHTNCLAALANMSSFFRLLNHYTTQRILSLITLLVKKHKRISEITGNTDTNITTSDSSLASVMINMETETDLHTLEEVIRMMLEIINSCLTAESLRYNVNLVYALLHKKKAFVELQKYTRFHDLLQNIETIISFFSDRVNELKQEPMSVEEIHDVIRNACVQLPSHHLHKFPDLKFRYVEEDCPEEFFVPYVWSLVFNKSGIYWNPGCVQLFTLE